MSFAIKTKINHIVDLKNHFNNNIYFDLMVRNQSFYPNEKIVIVVIENEKSESLDLY